MTTTYIGTDYGLGRTNINRATGIRYGVIPQSEVLQAWADCSETVYPECENPECEDGSCDDCQCGFMEPIGFDYEGDGYKASCGQDGDIFVVDSPYFTRAQFCSSCAPGACYLLNPCPDGERAYCFGHDWFEDGKAPYPVYSVETGELVSPAV